ncbi:MAG: hypothetical protein IKR84_07870 [Oscillibacter sp.]|nr:hypothetical protein [Oscillibacter sp.]
MSVITVVVLQYGGRCQARCRETDSGPFRVLRTDGDEWTRADRATLLKMWETVLDDIQADTRTEPFRILLCSDAPRADDSAPLPELGSPAMWNRQLLGEAMRGLPCEGSRWTVNGETLSHDDFREVFPRRRGGRPMYVYTVPEYRLPEGVAGEEDCPAERAACDALSVLAELLRTREGQSPARAAAESPDVLELIREALSAES